jgi:hypothetical protein
VRCIEWCGRLGVAALTLLGGCSVPSTEREPGGSTARPATPPVAARPAAPEPSPPAAAPLAKGTPSRLPEPRGVRSWQDVRQQAAERLVAANPAGTYTGVVPETLLAIPVLEIELNSDGSVRRIDVLRAPRQAKDTVALATAAVHRAAPFGNVSRLPKPWKFAETFLFDDERRFKPRTLDQ